MRRRLNLRVLAILVIGLPLLAGGIHLLHGYQVQRNAGALLEQADQAETQGDVAGTIDYLHRYVALARNDAPAWARLGLLLDRQAGSPREHLKAFFVIEHALRLDPEQPDARRQLARIALDLRRHNDARDHLDTLLRAYPQDAELMDLQGQCAVAAAQFDQAEGWWKRAVQQAPERVESWARRGGLLRRRLNRPEDADRVMDEMVAANPRSAVAYLARGRYRAEFQGILQSESDIAQALKLAPEDAEVLLVAADLDLSRNQPDAARAHLERGIRKHPGDGRFLLSMARLELRANQRTQAAEALRRSLPLLAEAPIQWTAADLLLDAGQTEEARKLLTRLEKSRILPARIDYLRARLAIADQNWSQARHLLEGARQGLAPSPTILRQAHLLLALCYQRLGNPDLQLASCRAAVAVDSTWQPARRALASATAATGRSEEALAQYQKLASQDRTSRLEAGRLLLRRNLRLPPDRRKWADVERFLNEATEEMKTGVEWRLLWAEVLMAQDRLAEAQKHLKSSLGEQPKQAEYYIGLAAIADRQKHPDQANELLHEAERRLGDRVDLRLARAVRVLPGPEEKTHAMLTRLSGKVSSFTRSEQVRLLEGLILVSLRANDIVLGRTLAGRLVQLQPNGVNGRFLAFRLALQARDAEAGHRELKELRHAEGEEGALWRYGEAALWARFAKADDKSGIAPARKRLAEASKLRPTWSPIVLLDAELCEREGNTDQAIDRYRQAVTLGERQTPIVRRVVQLLHERRRYAEAEEVLRHLREEAPLAGALGRLAAEVSLLGHRAPEQTVELARQAVKADGKDYREQLWFGQVLAAVDRRAEAEKAFRRAVELKADVPDTWVHLVLFLARGKQTEEAEKVLRDGQQKLGSTASKLPWAVCWESLGQEKKAGELYQAALKSKPEDPAVLRTVASFHLRWGQVAEAQPLLRKLVAEKVQTGQAAWARRNLALSLAMTGNYSQFKEALSLVDHNLTQPGAGVEDQRARALVLAMQPGRRRESIRLLEDSFARLPGTPEEQFLLARLYEADRNWPKARAILLDLLTATEAKNPYHLAYFASVLMRQDDLETAEHWLGKLVEREPKNARTTELKARLLRRQGRGAEAAALLQAFGTGKDAPTTLALARLLEELEQVNAAEKQFRHYAKAESRPEAALVLADFLARHGHCEEALALAERAGPKCGRDAFAGFAGGVARAKGITTEQRRQVEGWLKANLAKEPKSIATLLALAQLRDAQERFAEAQGLYRKVLSLEATNVMAANNLAVLLALDRKAEEAVQLSRQAIDRAGPQAPLLDTRGTAYLSAGQVEKALADLEEAVSQHPTAPRYYHLSRAYRAAKNRSGALLAYQKARKLGLNAAILHPLERPDYEKVRAEHEGN